MDTLMEFSIQGDIFFFYDTLSDEEIEKTMLACNPVEDNICESLIKQAEQKNAKDNMTAICLHILDDSEHE